MASYPILLSLEEGRERILQRTAPLGRESVSLEEADGRVLAEDVISALSPLALRWLCFACGGYTGSL